MDDLILDVEAPAGDVGKNGAFDFLVEDTEPPTVAREDQDLYTTPGLMDKKVPNTIRPGEQPTVQDSLDVLIEIEEPEPEPEPYPVWLIGGAIAVAAYILLGD